MQGKKREITPALLRRIEKLAGQMMTLDQIAGCVGMSMQWLAQNKAKHPELQAAVDRGNAKAVAEATRQAQKLIKTGDKDLIRFFLARKAKWTETQVHDVRVTGSQDQRDAAVAAAVGDTSE